MGGAQDTLSVIARGPDEVYERVSGLFTEEELVDLMLAVTNINTWNRLNVAFRTVPGNYRAGQYETWVAQTGART